MLCGAQPRHPSGIGELWKRQPAMTACIAMDCWGTDLRSIHIENASHGALLHEPHPDTPMWHTLENTPMWQSTWVSSLMARVRCAIAATLEVPAHPASVSQSPYVSLAPPRSWSRSIVPHSTRGLSQSSAMFDARSLFRGTRLPGDVCYLSLCMYGAWRWISGCLALPSLHHSAGSCHQTA